LFAIFGLGPLQSVEFSDTAGNNYIVNLVLENSIIEVLLQAVNTSNYVSVDLYIQNLSIMSLRSQVNPLLDASLLNMQTVTNNIEVLSLMTEVSQLF
jgi:hypothetical protein